MASQQTLRLLNDRAVIDELVQNGPSTVADLQLRTGISKPCVTDAMERLSKLGLVERAAARRTTMPGPNPVTWRIDRDRALAVVLTVDEAGSQAGVYSLDGSLLASSISNATASPATQTWFADRLRNWHIYPPPPASAVVLSHAQENPSIYFDGILDKLTPPPHVCTLAEAYSIQASIARRGDNIVWPLWGGLPPAGIIGRTLRASFGQTATRWYAETLGLDPQSHRYGLATLRRLSRMLAVVAAVTAVPTIYLLQCGCDSCARASHWICADMSSLAGNLDVAAIVAESGVHRDGARTLAQRIAKAALLVQAGLSAPMSAADPWDIEVISTSPHPPADPTATGI